MLNYGNVQNKIDLNSNYTWWYQASNFAKKESLSGVVLTSDNSYNPYLIPTNIQMLVYLKDYSIMLTKIVGLAVVMKIIMLLV